MSSRSWGIQRTLLLALLCLAPIASACGSSGSSEEGGGDIKIVRTADIESWDPGNVMSIQAFQTLPMVMEGLVRPSLDAKSVKPGLAQSWEFDPQAKTIAFKLRSGLKFSDGTRLTSEDVAFSIGLWREGMAMGGLYEAITGTETPDERTVVVKMSRPSTFTLTWLANGSAVVVPKDFGGKKREDFFAKPIGAGPFKIASHKVGQRMRLVRNPRYHDKLRPYVDGITYDIVADANQQLLRFQSGQADMIEVVPLDLVAQIPEDQRVRIESAATVDSIYVNHRRAPGDDIHFRRAVSLAIDREQFADTVFAGHAKPATGSLPPRVQGSVGCDCEYAFDLDEAKAELRQSSYEPGTTLKMVIPSSSEFSTKAGERAAALLGAVGIEVEVEKQEAQVLGETITKGEFDFTVGSISSVSSTVGDIFSLLIATDGMGAGVSMKALDGAFKRFDVAESDEQRAAAVREAEQWMHEELPSIPTVFPDRVLAISDTVEGLKVAPFGYYPADILRTG